MKNSELAKRVISILFILPLAFYFIIKGYLFFNIFLIFCCILTILEWHKMSKSIFFNIMGIFFIIFSFYAVSNIRNSDFYNGFNNFLFIFLICISTDIGGYSFGKFFKGPKLTKISPNKTYSGVIGSFALTAITCLFLISNNIIPKIENTIISNNFYILFFSIFLSAVSQIGDLVISYFKRISGLKDTGNIIPGHGGILDRIDGMLFAFPIFYLINLI